MSLTRALADPTGLPRLFIIPFREAPHMLSLFAPLKQLREALKGRFDHPLRLRPMICVALRGDTALHVAAHEGRGSSAEQLLKHKADTEAKNNGGPGPWKRKELL